MYHSQYLIINKGNLANTCEKNFLKILNSFSSSQFKISIHVLLNPITNKIYIKATFVHLNSITPDIQNFWSVTNISAT